MPQQPIDLSVLAGKPQAQPEVVLQPGVPLVNLQIGRGNGSGGPIVILHIHTPAGVLACHLPADKVEALTGAMRAAALGVTLASEEPRPYSGPRSRADG